MWMISLPLRIAVSKKAMFSLNLNQYRNTHPFTLNTAKVNFSKLVLELVKDLPHLPGCTLKYVLYVGSKRRCDISNICSVVDKFFCDALVDAGVIPDDSYDFLKEVTYCFGGLDKANPRVEVFIEPAESTEEDMQITLNQAEIELAITNYVHSQINVKEGMEIKIDIKATRGADGMTAMIDIVSGSPVAEPAAAPAPVNRPRLGSSTKTAAPVQENVELPSDPDANMDTNGDGSGDQPEVTPDADKVEPAVTKPKSGLFAGLKKPESNQAE